MKHFVKRASMIALVYTTMAQCADNLAILHIVKNFHIDNSPLSHVKVTVKQGNESKKTIFVSGIQRPTSVSYSLTGGNVTIEASLDDPEKFSSPFTAQDTYSSDSLKGNAIMVSNTATGMRAVSDMSKNGALKHVKAFNLTLGLVEDTFEEKADYKQFGPAQKPIKAYKTVEDNKQWTVRIVNAGNREMSKASFKKDTNNLYLQVNPKAVPTGFNTQFNSNIIQVFKGSKVTNHPDFTLTVNSGDRLYNELEIGPESAKFVPQGTQAQYTTEKKKIRAYKVVEKDKEWTVVIEDEQHNEIAKSTFKKNTGGFVRSLYLKLNTKNPRYTKNTVKVFKNKKVTGTPDFTSIIDAKNFDGSQKLEIDTGKAQLVDKGVKED